jgi:hypothetical protein
MFNKNIGLFSQLAFDFGLITVFSVSYFLFHLWFVLVSAFYSLKSWHNLGVFPWHGMGKPDSITGILPLRIMQNKIKQKIDFQHFNLLIAFNQVHTCTSISNTCIRNIYCHTTQVGNSNMLMIWHHTWYTCIPTWTKTLYNASLR